MRSAPRFQSDAQLTFGETDVSTCKSAVHFGALLFPADEREGYRAPSDLGLLGGIGTVRLISWKILILQDEARWTNHLWWVHQHYHGFRRCFSFLATLSWAWVPHTLSSSLKVVKLWAIPSSADPSLESKATMSGRDPRFRAPSGTRGRGRQ